MKDKLLKQFKEKEEEINKKLNSFKSLPESEYSKEFMFCLLTPQSQAKKCWQAVEELSKEKALKEEKVISILKTKTRFHNTKAKRILESKKSFNKIKKNLSNKNRKELRDYLSKNINGYGLKEASHFLRNIGKSDNQIAILDRHILRNLKSIGIIKEEKIKSPKDYLEIEKKFIELSKEIGITPDQLDLLWWSQENGEIFK